MLLVLVYQAAKQTLMVFAICDSNTLLCQTLYCAKMHPEICILLKNASQFINAVVGQMVAVVSG